MGKRAQSAATYHAAVDFLKAPQSKQLEIQQVHCQVFHTPVSTITSVIADTLASSQPRKALAGAHTCEERPRARRQVNGIFPIADQRGDVRHSMCHVECLESSETLRRVEPKMQLQCRVCLRLPPAQLRPCMIDIFGLNVGHLLNVCQ